MVMLNTEHSNISAGSSFGGSMCTCAACKKLRAVKNKAKTDKDTGLLDNEQICMDGLVLAFNAFKALEVQHPTDLLEFITGIHHLQDMLAVRVCRRKYPKGWPTQKETK